MTHQKYKSRKDRSMSRSPSRIYLEQDDIESHSISSYGVAKPRKRKLIAFGWYGGKFNHLDWLLPLLPTAHHYCEPFGGSGAALINRPPSPVETYNDLDGEVVNFFRVLREQRDELVSMIALTPFSREEYFLALSDQREHIPPIARALQFFVRARQARTGLGQTATLGRWANCKNTSRSGMSGVVSRWLGSVESLPEIALRLLRVQIENRPAAIEVALTSSNGYLSSWNLRTHPAH
jgi:DNA adenine methylase